jgi:hypothetical protein
MPAGNLTVDNGQVALETEVGAIPYAEALNACRQAVSTCSFSVRLAALASAAIRYAWALAASRRAVSLACGSIAGSGGSALHRAHCCSK